MGRKNIRNLNMPPNMIPRTRRSGRVSYYLHLTGTPRCEISLGDDLILALRNYAELCSGQVISDTTISLFSAIFRS